jgi:hypothetical protein
MGSNDDDVLLPATPPEAEVTSYRRVVLVEGARVKWKTWQTPRRTTSAHLRLASGTVVPSDRARPWRIESRQSLDVAAVDDAAQ